MNMTSIALKSSNPELSISKIRIAVFERDRYICRYCGKRMQPSGRAKITGGNDPVIEHMNGRSNDISNLCTSCRSCNSKKNSKTIFEWLDKIDADLEEAVIRSVRIKRMIRRFGLKREDCQ